jgi:hypothetical protein
MPDGTGPAGECGGVQALVVRVGAWLPDNGRPAADLADQSRSELTATSQFVQR